MLFDFANILVFIFLGILFVAGALVTGKFFRPHHPNPVKAMAYECGEPAVGSAWISFNIRFYVIALIFLIFDVEVALMFPVVVVFKKWLATGQGLLAAIEILFFVFILLLGLIFVWAMGDLEWVKTVKRPER